MPDEPQNQPQDHFPDPPAQPADDTPTDMSDASTEESTAPTATPEIEAEPSTQGISDSSRVFSDVSAPEPTTPDEPVVDGPPTPTPVVPVTAGGKASGGKKKWIVGSIIAAILVVLLGGGALAYNLWYQNPDKVILDGINNLFDPKANVSGKATVSLENEDVRLDVTANVKGDKKLANGDVLIAVQMKSADAPIEKVDMKADFALDDKTAYFKLNNLRPLAEDLVDAYVDSLAVQYQKLGFALTKQQISQQKSQMLQQLDPIINKIDNRWIKVDTESSDEDDESKCMTEAFQKLYDDKKTRNEVLDVYKDHKFITVKEKLGSKDGSLGYLLEYNESVAKDFSKAVKQTSIGKEIQKCDKSGSSPSTNEDSTNKKDSLKNTRIELWVSRWSHQITEMKFGATTTDSSETAISLGVTYNYGKVDGLTVPDDAVDIKELEKEFNGDDAGANPTGLIPLSI